ncbi:hypothetical protein DENSPDRAFT_756726, partial [Dentipellis sp. KUC8613]
VTKFVKQYEKLCKIHNVRSDRDKCQAVLDYCSDKVKRYIKSLKSYKRLNWEMLRADLLERFDADRTIKRYSVRDLTEFVEKNQKKKITTAAAFKNYDINFRSISQELRTRNKIDEDHENTSYWLGIGLSLRRRIEEKVLNDDKNLTLDEPFDMDTVYHAALSLLARDRFDSHSYVDRNIEEEEEASDHEETSDWRKDVTEDSSSSDDDDDSPPRRRHRTLSHRSSTSSNKKVRWSDREPERNSTQDTPPRRDPPRQKRQNESTTVQDLISQLSNMKVSDPNYAVQYYQALKLDKDIEKIIPPPAYQASATSPARQTPPHMSSRSPSPRPYTFGSGTNDMICYGCGERGHGMTRCPTLAKLMDSGILKRNENGQIARADGSVVRRFGNETFAEVVERERAGPSARTHFLSASFHESDGYESAGEVYYLPTIDPISEDSDQEWYPVMPAQRETMPRRRRQGRRLAIPPKEEKTPRTALRRGPAKNLEPLVRDPKEKPMEYVPVDTGHREFHPDDDDAFMEDLSEPKGARSRQRATDKASDERRKPSARKSAISVLADPSRLMGELLKTPFSVTIGELLGVSREMSQLMSENLKMKSVNLLAKPDWETYHASEPESESDIPESYVFGAKTHGLLISINMECNGSPIRAIIDTGSELNVVRTDVYRTVIQQPMDVEAKVRMNDVNGNQSTLRGLVQNVGLRCGAVATLANMYVADNVPFAMLLGRPWQRGNFVSIDERTEGTYLMF